MGDRQLRTHSNDINNTLQPQFNDYFGVPVSFRLQATEMNDVSSEPVARVVDIEMQQRSIIQNFSAGVSWHVVLSHNLA